MGFLSGAGGGDKWVDRSWDWAKDMSRKTEGGWDDIYNKSLLTASGGQSPWAANTYSTAQGLMSPYMATGQTDQSQNPLFQQISSLYDPWAQGTNPYESEMFKGASSLYGADSYMNEMYEPMKRSIEGQYGQNVDQMLATGVRGGSLVDMLSGAGSDRMTALNDMERGLRTQDIQRGDVRAQALNNLAQSMYQQQESGRLARASGLETALMQLNSQDEQQQLTARMYLANLMNTLNETDIARARSMADVGVQGRYLTGNQLAGGGMAQDSGLMGGMLSMGSMLGMGMGGSGSSGGGGGLSSIFSGLFSGGGGSGIEANGYGF